MKVGITGNIGSGKSTVCFVFSLLGIPVYDADNQARRLMVENESLKEKIISLLGKDSYLPSGELNRKAIADVIFNDQSKLSKLNSLVHPAVAFDSIRWHEVQLSKYSIKEAALLIESGSYKSLDKLIVVTAPLSLRIKRVMNRDKTTEDKVREREEKQIPQDEKTKLADYIISNDEKSSLIEQVLKIHKYLLAEATNPELNFDKRLA